jgi:hypothetical protein
VIVELHLQDGFTDDTVEVRADGEVLLRQEHLTTNLSSSVASIVQFQCMPGEAVEIAVPTRGISADVVAPPSADDPTLSANLGPDGLVVNVEEVAPRYM